MGAIVNHIGETNRATNGMLITIIAYRKSKDIDVQFEDGTIVRNKCIGDFNRGLIKYPTKLKYIGSENINKQGRHMKIIEYKNNKEVIIQFDDGITIKRSLESFVNRVAKHPNDIKSRNKKEKILTEAEIAEKEFRKELKEKCELAGIKYDTALYCHRKHDSLSVDDIISKYSEHHTKETYNGKSIRQACKDLGINIGTVYKLKSSNKELSYTSIIDRLVEKNKKKSFAELCREHNINEVNAYGYKKRYTDKSDEEIIEIILSKNKSFRQKCLDNNIDYKKACTYKSSHPELSEEQIIEYYKQPKQKSLRQKCKENNVSYSTAMKYRAKYPDLSDEQLIEQIIDNIKNRDATFISLCEKYKVNYNAARTYRRNHPELSDEQVIIAYRPDLRLNIFGEIIE